MSKRYELVPGYDDRQWRALRATKLAESPLCVLCRQIGAVTAATVVDHIKPHAGDPVLFWDYDNLQSLCKPCHDSAKRRQENGKGLPGCDSSGEPLDPQHHWNLKKKKKLH